jgi:REP element-mobilizing transposase RayT
MRVPGGTFLVTCTTHDSRFLLKPSPVVEQVVLYCLFRAAARHDVLVHAAVVESSHIHLVVTDTRGLLSDFMTWLDRHVAVCLLEHYRPNSRTEVPICCRPVQPPGTSADERACPSPACACPAARSW